ncbi:hypothetical protein SUSAZ_04115 [Sulfolobus acidocaldarius SUSAZ]|nr:hypothetical protein SUSAZ_04115 [Sulfolobus acidocaldarius SUSAZ]
MSISLKIKALTILNKTSKRKVMVLEDWGPFDNGTKESILNKGTEDEIELWLANILQDRGIVKMIDMVTIDELGKILFQEKQTASVPASLIKLPKDFYFKVRTLFNELKKKNDVATYENIKKAYQMLSEIMSIRIRKIIQLAYLNVEDENLMDRMTTEEILLYKNIKYAIEKGPGDIVGNPFSA